MRFPLKCLSSLFLFIAAHNSWAKSIPEEYESLGGHSLGFGNSGSAASSGLGSVRSNPAMLSLEREYSLSAGYHWPSKGREFYQAGAVDGKTSPVAAGIVYTSSQGNYQSPEELDGPNKKSLETDSPVKFRVAGGAAQNYGQVSLGITGQYIEAHSASATKNEIKNGSKLIKGTTLGFGIAGLITKSIRFGISTENLVNQTVSEFAPKTYRAGLAYTLLAGNLTLHLDYLQRERVKMELQGLDQIASKPNISEAYIKAMKKPEQLLTASGSVRVQDLVRCLFAFGSGFSKQDTRKLWGAGLALVKENFSLSYMLSSPNLAEGGKHHALNVSTQVAL